MRVLNKLTRCIYRVLLLCLALISLSGCTLDNISAQQVKTSKLWDELIGGTSFGQSFISTDNNLYRIDLSTATFSRTNTAPVIFTLKNIPQDTSSIFSIEIPGPDIQNERPTSIEFPPIHDSAGKSYYFSIESPEGTSGNAITVYANDQDQYPAGSAYQDSQAVSGDLVFTAYSHENFTFPGVMRDIVSRAAQDVPFLIFWGILILGVCVSLAFSFRRPSFPG
jgi:hypothetical protein